MIDTKQKKLINTAKSILIKQGKLTEENYRDILGGLGFESITDPEFNTADVRQLIKAFEKLGFVPVNKYKRGDRASYSQKEMLRKMWRENPNVADHTEKALGQFIKRIVRIDNIEWLPANRIPKLVEAIKNIKPLKSRAEE